LSSQVLLIQGCIDDFYRHDKAANSADREIITAAVLRKVTNPKHQDAFRELLAEIPSDVSAENVDKEILEVAKESTGIQLAQSILNKKYDAALLQSYQDILELTELEDEDKYKVYESPTMESLIPKTERSARIPLWPLSLTNRLDGGCLAGDHVLVYARPEMGKTATALNFCRGIAKQGRSVLYCSNEDSIQRLLVRAKSSFSGLTYNECLEQPDEADKLAAQRGFDLVRFVEMYPGTVHQIEGLVKEYRPDVLIVDQLINLLEKKSENYTLMLGVVARGIRNLAKHYGLVAISYAQAGDSADNKLVLDLGDVNWSNTDLQGAVDLMIGMGANHEFLQRDWRMLSLCKNKLSGAHDYFPVKIDRERSRMASIQTTR
jgi:archaellum biogenesis ATPase FlaH